MTTKQPYCILAAWLVVVCQNVNAQNDTTIHREIDRIDIVAPARKHQASPVQEISRVEMERLGIKSTADALRMFNGVNIKDYGGIGGLTTVSVRSLGAAHTAVSYDGVPVSNTQAGPVDISMFSISDISSIKLAVGSGDQLLQPARLMASAATLGIEGIDFIPTDSTRHSANANLKCGSFGYWFTNVKYSSRLTKRMSLTTNAEIYGANGEYPYTLVNFNKTTREHRTNTDVLSYKGEIGISHIDSIGNTLKIKAYAYHSDRGLPGSIIFYNKTANERLMERNIFVQSTYRRRLSPTLTAKMIAKYNYSFSRYDDTNVKYKDGHLQQNSTQYEGYISLMTLWQPWRTISMSVSLDEIYNILNTDITDNPQPRRNTMIAAGNVRFSDGKWITTTISAIATRVRENVDHGSKLNNLDKICPSLTMKITPFHNTFIRLMARQTFRVPTFNELYYTTLGFSGLRPERATEYNVGIGVTFLGTTITADIFRNIVRDKIVATPTTYVWKMANYGKAHITGAELSAEKMLKIQNINSTFSAGYTYQHALDKTRKNPKLFNSQIPYTPLHSGHYSLTAEYQGFTLGYHALWSGKMYFLEQNIPENQMDGYIEHTISLSKIILKHLTIKASCINIGDAQYDIIKFYPMPGRQWQLQLSLTL
ncbi:MAG: TonB-dependent receptor [Bacteroidales bacterium]|nr:TonB-dependent receptor [Bacteroidales bacterium]